MGLLYVDTVGVAEMLGTCKRYAARLLVKAGADPDLVGKRGLNRHDTYFWKRRRIEEMIADGEFERNRRDQSWRKKKK